jgi:hypothetical protein
MRARSMMLRFAMASLSLMALSALAAQPTKFSAGREISAAMLVLPTSDPGLLTITCLGCTTESFLTSLQTEYSIGRELVSLQDFRAYVATLPAYEAMLVQVADDRRHVVRVVAPTPRQQKGAS